MLKYFHLPSSNYLQNIVKIQFKNKYVKRIDVTVPIVICPDDLNVNGTVEGLRFTRSNPMSRSEQDSTTTLRI